MQMPPMTRPLIFACLIAVALGQECDATRCNSAYMECQSCSTLDPGGGGFCFDNLRNDPANDMPQDCNCVEKFVKCINALEVPGTCILSDVTAQERKTVQDQCFDPKTVSFPVPDIDSKTYQEECKVEVIFLVDLSASIDLKTKPGNVRNNIKLRSFVAEIMLAIEGSVGKAKFSLSYFMGRQYRGNGTFPERVVPGNIKTAEGVDTMFDLTLLPKIEGEGGQNILDILMNQRREPQMALGGTPTAAAFDRAREQFEDNGDPTVGQRLTILLSDGGPTLPENKDDPLGEYAEAESGAYAMDLANAAVKKLKENTLLMTVGINFDTPEGIPGQVLMQDWASEPKTLLAFPSVEFDKLPFLIPKILVLLCPVIEEVEPCLAKDETVLTIKGRDFLQTPETECLFIDTTGPNVYPAKATFVDSQTIVCSINLADNLAEYPILIPGKYTAFYRQQAFLKFTEAITFSYGRGCDTSAASPSDKTSTSPGISLLCLVLLGLSWGFNTLN